MSRNMRQGLPQGSVLSLIIFLFYINELAKKLPTTNINSLYADDVSVLATKGSKEEAEQEAQPSIDIITQWAKSWKFRLNATKSETVFSACIHTKQNGHKKSQWMAAHSSSNQSPVYSESPWIETCISVNTLKILSLKSYLS